MMKRALSLPLCLLLFTAACEQDPQLLSFGPEDGSASASVPASGGVVTSAMGGSVAFPAGALPGGTTVTVTPTSTPAVVAESGTPASNSFAVSPENVALAAPVTVDLKMSASHLASSGAWTTSLVNVNAGTQIPYGLGNVDLATGIVRTEVDELGTMTLVRPGAGSMAMMERVTGSPTATVLPAAVAGTDVLPGRIEASCAVTPCPTDARPTVSLVAPAGALPSYAEGAVIFWEFTGGFDIADRWTVAGEMNADLPVRIRMTPSRPGSYAPVVSVPFRARLAPTISTTAISTETEVTLTFVEITLDWGSGPSTSVQHLVFTRTAGGGEVVLQRTFDFDGQAIGIRAVLPVNFD